MKRIGDAIFSIVILAAVIGLGWGSYTIGNRKYESLRDSISAMVPDTVHHYDTIMPVDSINWIDSINLVNKYVYYFDTIYMDTLTLYNDSISTDDVTIFIQEKVKGLIMERDVGYRLKVPLIIRDSVIINKPYPVIQKAEGRTGIYYGLGMGFGREGFAVSGGVDVLTKKNRIYGAEYLRTESRGYLMLNVKFKL